MQIFDVYPRFTVSPQRGKGVFIFDDSDKKYLDLYGGHGVISVGHSHPEFVKAVSGQLSRIAFYSNSVKIPVQEEFASKLGAMSGYPGYQLFLCNSGAEANENALKIASFHTGKNRVIAFKNSFHGRTSAALNVTDNSKLSAPLNRNNFPVDFIEMNDVPALHMALQKKDACAVILEGIQGVGGLDGPSNDFLKLLSRLCYHSGALLILDEIQSGTGRTGKFFSHQWSGIEPDIITLAKGMGNGFPIGGVLIHPQIKSWHGMLGTTFGGNYLACMAGIAVLDIIRKENLLEHVSRVSKIFVEAVHGLPGLTRIKGRGFMLGLEFDFPISELRKQLLYDHRIFTGGSANPNLLRILPPLNITEGEILMLPNALNKILK